MNKQELLNDLTAKFYKLGHVAPVELGPADVAVRDAENVKWYIAGVYENKDDRLIRRNISFYVEHENETKEFACYSEKLPEDNLATAPPTVFREIVLTEIANYIASGVIEKAVIDSVNEKFEFAITTAYILDTNEIVIKRYFVYNDKDATLQFKVIRD